MAENRSAGLLNDEARARAFQSRARVGGPTLDVARDMDVAALPGPSFARLARVVVIAQVKAEHVDAAGLERRGHALEMRPGVGLGEQVLERAHQAMRHVELLRVMKV